MMTIGMVGRRSRAAAAVRTLPFLLLALASPLVAQDSSGTLWCFRAHPAPECRSYSVVEVQGVVPIASTKQDSGGRRGVEVFNDNNVEFNLGHMVNVGPDWSVGGSVALGSGSGGVPDGGRARARWWWSSSTSLEFEAGLVRTNLGRGLSPIVGPSIGARLHVHSFGSVLLRYDRLDVPPDGGGGPGGPASGLSLGVGVASERAVWTSLAIGLAMVALVVALPAS